MTESDRHVSVLIVHSHSHTLIVRGRLGLRLVQGGPKMAPFLYALTFVRKLTLPNINRFSKLFHCQHQEKICNNTITKDPTTPQVCRYTTL